MTRPIFLLTMVLTQASFAQKNTLPLFDKLLYVSGKDSLPYRLLKPAGMPAKKDFPLVIFLHGAGERGNDNEVQIKHVSTLFSDAENRRRFPCFVVAPQCPENKSWASHDRGENGPVMRAKPNLPMALLIQLIDEIERDFPIDRSRIYVTGLSMGGFGTWDLIARFPDRFAAAVPICGGGDRRTAQEIKHVPLWAFHGALDNVVPPRYSRAMIRALQEAGGVPGYTEYPDVGHDSWTYAYQDPHLLTWLFDQYLGKKPKK